jgi:hypothetical protein
LQIFFPYPSLKESVSCLDPKRLGNGIYREALTLIRGGWPNHPASRIWANHKHALAQYSLFGLQELTRRGRHYPHHYVTFQKYLDETPDTGMPPITLRANFCAAMRSNLLRKNKEYYGQFGWTEPDNLPYVWE